MTRQEMKILNSGGIVPSHPIQSPVLPNAFTPPGMNVFNEGIPKPLQQGDFNAVPLADIEFLHESKNMDVLHRTDTLAVSYNRGANLKDLAKNLGHEKFQKIYTTLKK